VIVSGVVVDGDAELVEGADAAFDFVADDDVAGRMTAPRCPPGR
jgi:hypothetical protein